MIAASKKVLCFHCGQPCDDDELKLEEKNFCCYGCMVVYELIRDNELCEYYNIESHPGMTATRVNEKEYEELGNPEIRKKILEFDSNDFARVRFKAPAMHCSSCIWLLESLQKVDKGVLMSEVNFQRKEVCIDFNPGVTTLPKLAALLDALGYSPLITTEDGKKNEKRDLKLVIQLGIAGFAFGNVMLFSFPEYLGLDGTDEQLRRLFSWLNLFLSVPVILYSARDYFTSAARSFRQKQINIDVPIALGLMALFLRSSFDIVTGFGPGYLDSFTGLVFFLLIGRWFQGRTYEALSFERDYKSYFPLAVQQRKNDAYQSTVVYDLKKGDEIRIRNLEIVPADSTLVDRVAYIDYSFVTGEARPVKAASGDLVYAGGRLIGQPATFIVEKETTQSHLTSLWNKEVFQKKYESRYRRIIDRSARIFTWIVLTIAAVTAIYWYATEPGQTWLILTSVLMVACPCALALAAPFTYGTMLRAFGRNNFYLKNADVIERLAVIDSVVFDKTGTITHENAPKIFFNGELTNLELAMVGLLTGCSTHPLSTLIHQSIIKKSSKEIKDFREWPGKGIAGVIDRRFFKIGSAAFVGSTLPFHTKGSQVFVSIDDEIKGYFLVGTSVREKIGPMLSRLGQRCRAMLSGDNDAELVNMKSLFPATTDLMFNLQPSEKMQYVSDLQSNRQKVLMIGDGLNDAGALKQADVGIAVTDDAGLFTPGSDGILQGNQLQHLDKFLSLARSSTRILKTAFAISFMYNVIALTFAVTGHLTPLVAAILMPMSSVSVVGFSTIAVNTIVKFKLGKST